MVSFLFFPSLLFLLVHAILNHYKTCLYNLYPYNNQDYVLLHQMNIAQTMNNQRVYVSLF